MNAVAKTGGEKVVPPPQNRRALSRRTLLLRLPLIAATLVVLTALLVASSLGLLTRQYLIEDVDSGATQAVSAWGNSLPSLIQQDNVWGAYEALVAVTGPNPPQSRPEGSLAVILTPGGQVFASSNPALFPTARAPDWSPLWRNGSLETRALPDARGLHPGQSPPIESGNWRIYVSALRADSSRVAGTLVYAVSDGLYRQRLRSMLLWIATITLLATGVFVPVVWILTRRLLAPLARLEASMGQDIGMALRTSGDLARRSDEVGTLAAAFTRLLEQSERLRQTDKLAAVGALAATTAHEINNPLGGMINALHTAQQFGHYDDTTRQTLDLLDRGLEQLHHTARALLSQTRHDQRPLSSEDFVDLAEIIQPCGRERQLHLESAIHCDDLASVALPAGPVRQASLNILINACNAAEPRSRLRLEVRCEDRALLVQVANKGPAPPSALLSDDVGLAAAQNNGYGLRESRRLLADLGGSLSLSHQDGETTAMIRIPLPC